MSVNDDHRVFNFHFGILQPSYFDPPYWHCLGHLVFA